MEDLKIEKNNQKLDPKTEEKLQEKVEILLRQGKPNWDIPHTQATVSWMRELIKAEGGNERILVPVMYLHDTGYPEVREGYNFEELMASKAEHEELGAQNAREILPGLGFSSQEV